MSAGIVHGITQDIMPTNRRRQRMACKCVSCPECGGTGNVWVSFNGKYLGKCRCDDFDELEMCEECNGTGIIEMCDECMMAKEEAEEF